MILKRFSNLININNVNEIKKEIKYNKLRPKILNPG